MIELPWHVSADRPYAYEDCYPVSPPDYEQDLLDYSRMMRAGNEAFNLDTYLEDREDAGSFSFVELGHRVKPISFYIPNLTGQRTYVGIETWIRDRNPYDPYPEKIKKLYAQSESMNAAYHFHPLPGKVFFDADDEAYEHPWYSGEYPAETIMPPGAADELFLANILGDPTVAYSERRDAILAESARLLAPSGTMVIRETMTPRTSRMDAETLDNAGLEPLAYFGPDTTTFGRLEEVYSGWTPDDGCNIGVSAYFAFLGKIANPASRSS